MDDIKVVLQEFSLWKMDFVRRDSNCAAHFLANWAVRMAIKHTWTEDVPECIREVIVLEQDALGA